MTKPKNLEQLRTEKERAETQLAQEQHKLERLENLSLIHISRRASGEAKSSAVYFDTESHDAAIDAAVSDSLAELSKDVYKRQARRRSHACGYPQP